MTLTVERLREVLSYDPETGVFRWIERGGGRSRKNGGEAGSRGKTRYRFITIDWKPYLVHRLAWLYVHGRWPRMIDHINGEKWDNRLCNLRECTHAENQRNQPPTSRNKLGVRGVSRKANRFQVQVTHAGRDHYVGSYLTLDEAKAAYNDAARRLHGEFARTA